MRIALVLGIFFVMFLLVSCTPEQVSTSEELAGTSPSEITVADRQILEQYPDDLDAAWEELEMAG